MLRASKFCLGNMMIRSDRELTKRCGLLESSDTVMADCGFNIQDNLTPLGARVNIPPFLKGKEQLEPNELVET